ncbi:hypothetical protein HU200_000565 [Digitaria exilis]|uniref:Uncharacterized protein n=1 Tax=Digitaria exilis TaxID=1010633 RepID=A0A835BJ16_9POAL|nr:hypothetical protein HU200_034647 [Digitaria exilis]KAF8747102.1 hypothetical protein HU200_013296 [Digitaria exilis]KAF8781305.1 hypothetical protein HU200_000565 [Digitaria exilis]
MSGVPERQSWPDLLHKDCQYAESVIRRDRPDLNVITLLVVYDPMPPIEEFDRVIIWCYAPAYIVDRIPTQG